MQSMQRAMSDNTHSYRRMNACARARALAFFILVYVYCTICVCVCLSSGVPGAIAANSYKCVLCKKLMNSAVQAKNQYVRLRLTDAIAIKWCARSFNSHHMMDI